MTSRDIMEVQSQLRGPLWTLFKEFISARKESHLSDLDSSIEGLGDIFERERAIGARKESQEIVDRFPIHVEELFKQALKKENNE